MTDADGYKDEGDSPAGERDTLRPPAGESPDSVTLALAPVMAKLALIHEAVKTLTDEVARLGERQRQESSDVRESLADHERRLSRLEQSGLNGHG